MRKSYVPKGCDQQGRYASGWYESESWFDVFTRFVRKLKEQAA